MDRSVLGINFGTHDAAAAVVRGGKVLAAAEEERFSRVKHTKEFPARAIAYCLDAASITVADVEQVAFFVDPRLHLLLPLTNGYHGFPAALGSLRSDLDKYVKRRRQMKSVRSTETFSGRGVRLVPVAHHRAHAASAYLTSPFDDALVVTLDGRGEFETACVFDGCGADLRLRHRTVYPHSFGYFYSMITRYLGFRPQHDEYKVMGLAAYGEPNLVDRVQRLLRVDPTNGRLSLDLRYFDHHRRPSPDRALFSHRLVDLLGPPREPGEEITGRHAAVAHAAQKVLESGIGNYLKHARRVVPRRRLCLAGGVALNCVANSAVLGSDAFDEVYVQPAAGDAGTSVGAALVVERAGGNRERAVMTNAFLGPSYPRADVERALRAVATEGCRIVETADPAASGAGLLGRGLIVGWFSGRMEFGPRALGARSIVAGATRADTAERINAKIKRRELFRPLAPAVLHESANDYFQLSPAGALVYPFMLATAPVRPERAARIPAVVHTDGSARVQTVDQATNPAFWRLIESYRKVTGVPVVLNTSFNHASEPIVCSPADAVRTFLACRLDALVIDRYVVLARTVDAGI